MSGFSDYINAKENGLYGDGVHDDTAAMQALLNAAKTNYSQAMIYFPQGEYLFTGPLANDSSRALTLVGCGVVGNRDGYHNWWNGTCFIFKTAGAAYTGLTLGEHSLGHCGPQIQGINFIGVNASGQSTGGSNLSLLEIRNLNRWRISSCSFRGATTGTGTGVLINTNSNGTQRDASWGYLEHCIFEQVVHCVRSPYLEGGYEAHGCDFESTSTSVVHAGPQLRLIANKFDGAPTGVLIAGGSANAIIGNAFEQCLIGVEINSAGYGNRGDNNRIIGNHFRGRNGAQGEIGVLIGNGCSGNVVKGNTYEVTAINVSDNGSGNYVSQNG